MGVFGTLRERCSNNRLMHQTDVSNHRLAFLPHFNAEGLGVSYEKNSTAPFEVFTYTPEDFAKMVYRVDCLESFNPASDHGMTNGGYYYRTLVWLRLLPEGYEDDWFTKSGQVNIWGYRNMEIPPETWDNYEKIPAWVYSNKNATNKAAKEKNTPIIW